MTSMHGGMSVITALFRWGEGLAEASQRSNSTDLWVQDRDPVSK